MIAVMAWNAERLILGLKKKISKYLSCSTAICCVAVANRIQRCVILSSV